MKHPKSRLRRRRKQYFVDKFGGKCQICGYSKCINALEFHHIEEKTNKPTNVIFQYSIEKAEKELEKCIMVCANCHREIHYEDYDSNIQKLYTNKKWIIKKCIICKKEFKTKDEKQLYHNEECKNIGFRKIKERPSKDELQELIIKFDNWSLLGRMFGVSDNAVRKWAKKYKIIF